MEIWMGFPAPEFETVKAALVVPCSPDVEVARASRMCAPLGISVVLKVKFQPTLGQPELWGYAAQTSGRLAP
jgi:hypothetical protein